MARSGGSASASSLFLRPMSGLWRLRARITVETLLSLAVAGIAVGLVVGYQVLAHWARRSGA